MFLCAVFDQWRAKDAGRKHVQIIDVSLGNLRGIPSSLCVHNPLCGHSGSVESKVAVWYGAKEPNMKKAVKKLKRAFPNAELHPFPGFGHGEIIAHPERMAAEIKQFMGGNTP